LRDGGWLSRRAAWVFVAAVTLVLTPVIGVISAASPAAALTGTTTSIFSSNSATGYGEFLGLYATVSPVSGSATPTGTVTFFDGTQAFGTASLDNTGFAFLGVSTQLAAGSHTITAQYNGDGTFASSVSNAVTEVINPQGTYGVILSTVNPAAAGDTTVLIAVVLPNNGVATPSGSVVFFVNGTSMGGILPLDSNGEAVLSWTPAAGQYQITFQYTSDSANWLNSTAPPLTEQVFVGTPPTTSVITPSNATALSGTAATLDATATNATSVEFVLFGGGYWNNVIGTATPTYYGWLYSWNTKTVATGSYVLLSEAFNSGGSAFSPAVNITVTN
jgi:hypothetical protein